MKNFWKSIYLRIPLTLYNIVLAVILVTAFSCVTVYATEEENPIDTSALAETYTALYAPDYAPYSYIDEDGEAQGMVIAMMEYIADYADIEFVYISNESEYDIEDIDMNLSMLERDAVSEISIESSSYFEFPLTLLGADEWDGATGSVVGCLDYITLSRDDIFKAINQNGLRTYYNYEELADAYNNGEVDYIVVSSIVSTLLDIDDIAGTYNVSLSLDLESVIMFNNDMSGAEIDTFNEIIDNIDITDIYHLLVEAAMAASMEGDVTFFELMVLHRVEIVATVIILLLGWLLTIYYLRQKALLDFINVDKLTGVSTERKFMEDTENLLKKNMHSYKYQIISLDVDNFKYINESFGMVVGTEVIERISECTKNQFGDIMIFFARVVADKFLILTRQWDDATETNIRNSIVVLEENLKEVLGTEYRFHVSVGIYLIDDSSLPVRYMADCANIARNQGKSIYEHTFIRFSKELETQLRVDNSVVGSMEYALENREFKMVYQPKISLKTGKIAGAEALVRWVKVDGTQIFPDQFIPILERNGFIISLDYYVLDSVCSFIKDKPDLHRVSVNFSGFTMIKGDFANTVISIVENYNIDPSRLEIEVTESAFVESYDLMIGDINRLREYGFVIAMDDFGTGVSSLGRLNDMFIDVLKIDKQFISDTLTGVRGRSIVSAVIDMAKSLHIETVAEGVETEEQMLLLKELGCDIVQGYFYARPLTPEQFLSYIETFDINKK